MGLDIGATARAISSLAPVGFSRPERLGAPRDARTDDAAQLGRQEEDVEIRVGFGENTLSPSGAALRTLEGNLEAALQLVPTVQELRERARVNQAVRTEAIEARTERSSEVRRLETVRPEPSAAVRNFLQDSDLTAVQARSVPAEDATANAETSAVPDVRLGANAAESTDRGPDAVPARPEPAPRSEPAPQRLDIRV